MRIFDLLFRKNKIEAKYEFLREDGTFFTLTPLLDKEGKQKYEYFLKTSLREVKDKGNADPFNIIPGSTNRIPKFIYSENGKETILLIDIYTNKLKDFRYVSLVANTLLSKENLKKTITEEHNYVGGFCTLKGGKQRRETPKTKIKQIQNTGRLRYIRDNLNETHVARGIDNITDSYRFTRSNGSQFVLTPRLDENACQIKKQIDERSLPMFTYYPIDKNDSSKTKILNMSSLLLDIDVTKLEPNNTKYNEKYKQQIADILFDEKRIQRMINLSKEKYDIPYIYMGGFFEDKNGNFQKFRDPRVQEYLEQEYKYNNPKNETNKTYVINYRESEPPQVLGGKNYNKDDDGR